MAYEGVKEPEYESIEKKSDEEDEYSIITKYYDKNGVLRKKIIADCDKVLDELYFYDEKGNEILNVDVSYSCVLPYTIYVNRYGDGIRFPEDICYSISITEKKNYMKYESVHLTQT